MIVITTKTTVKRLLIPNFELELRVTHLYSTFPFVQIKYSLTGRVELTMRSFSLVTHTQETKILL